LCGAQAANAKRLRSKNLEIPEQNRKAAFIEVYAKSLPALVKKALETRTSKH
jgi:hypothetical protein